MIYGSKRYLETDIDFSMARSVIRGVYFTLETISLVGGLIACCLVIPGWGKVVAILCGLMNMLFVHLFYCFAIGFFELIKNVRQVRDELAQTHQRTMASSDNPVEHWLSGSTPSSKTRYDAATHQYVKE